jgi:hypothetical protein
VGPVIWIAQDLLRALNHPVERVFNPDCKTRTGESASWRAIDDPLDGFTRSGCVG